MCYVLLLMVSIFHLFHICYLFIIYHLRRQPVQCAERMGLRMPGQKVATAGGNNSATKMRHPTKTMESKLSKRSCPNCPTKIYANLATICKTCTEHAVQHSPQQLSCNNTLLQNMFLLPYLFNQVAFQMFTLR